MPVLVVVLAVVSSPKGFGSCEIEASFHIFTAWFNVSFDSLEISCINIFFSILENEGLEFKIKTERWSLTKVLNIRSSCPVTYLHSIPLLSCRKRFLRCFDIAKWDINSMHISPLTSNNERNKKENQMV